MNNYFADSKKFHYNFETFETVFESILVYLIANDYDVTYHDENGFLQIYINFKDSDECLLSLKTLLDSMEIKSEKINGNFKVSLDSGDFLVFSVFHEFSKASIKMIGFYNSENITKIFRDVNEAFEKIVPQKSKEYSEDLKKFADVFSTQNEIVSSFISKHYLEEDLFVEVKIYYTKYLNFCAFIYDSMTSLRNFKQYEDNMFRFGNDLSLTYSFTEDFPSFKTVLFKISGDFEKEKVDEIFDDHEIH